MRVPRDWDDKSIIEDSPALYNSFYARTFHQAKRGGEADDINATTASSVLAEENGPAAVEAWLYHAFVKKAKLQFEPKATKEITKIFVEFFWTMYQGRNYELFLRQEAKKMGSEVFVVASTDRPFDDTTSLSFGKKRNRARSSTELNRNVVAEEAAVDRPLKRACVSTVESSIAPSTANRPMVIPMKEECEDRVTHLATPPPDAIFAPHLENDRIETSCPTQKTSWLTPNDNWGIEDLNLIKPEEDLCSLQLDLSHSSDKCLPTPVMIPPKSPLNRYPPIWAESRQEVCETFEWFRAYHGGVYFSNGIAKGYLLGGSPSRRDLFHHDGKLIISHGGGRNASIHVVDGVQEIRGATDQTAQDISIRSLLSSYTQKQPIALLIDDKYQLFPYDLRSKSILYAVLGLYLIVHVWAEMALDSTSEKGWVVRFKFAFQWYEPQGLPWWLNNVEMEMSVTAPPTPLSATTPPGSSVSKSSCQRRVPVKKGTHASPGTDEQTRRSLGIYRRCSTCKTDSPHVYIVGWVCLQPTCVMFWRQLTTGQHLPSEDLTYNSNFLALVPTDSLPPGCDNLLPQSPLLNARGTSSTSEMSTKGWHCRDCGRLSSRFKWQHWECAHCQRFLKVDHDIRSYKELWGVPLSIPYQDNRIEPTSGITRHPRRVFIQENMTGTYQTFTFPRNRGCIHHIQSGAVDNSEAGEIFAQYQRQAADGTLQFRRWPLRAHKSRGTLLTNYFSQNSGEPYKYVGGTENTVPFDQAPDAVVRAHQFMQARVRHVMKNDEIQFNEVLSAAYMEKQSMAYHSDAEIGLGPLVASLSLGAAALMHFRSRKSKTVVLSIVLRHGDILIMDGADVQHCYEHTVVPSNLRIAATARYITPLHGTGTTRGVKCEEVCA